MNSSHGNCHNLNKKAEFISVYVPRVHQNTMRWLYSQTVKVILVDTVDWELFYFSTFSAIEFCTKLTI